MEENKKKISDLTIAVKVDTSQFEKAIKRLKKDLEKIRPFFLVRFKDIAEETRFTTDALFNKDEIQYILIDKKNFSIKIIGNFISIESKERE